jgi:hypothetical protein
LLRRPTPSDDIAGLVRTFVSNETIPEEQSPSPSLSSPTKPDDPQTKPPIRDLNIDASFSYLDQFKAPLRFIKPPPSNMAPIFPAAARWTKIDRKLVNPRALEEANLKFEEWHDSVIVAAVLLRDAVQDLAERTEEIRRARYDEREREWRSLVYEVERDGKEEEEGRKIRLQDEGEEAGANIQSAEEHEGKGKAKEMGSEEEEVEGSGGWDETPVREKGKGKGKGKEVEISEDASEDEGTPFRQLYSEWKSGKDKTIEAVKDESRNDESREHEETDTGDERRRSWQRSKDTKREFGKKTSDLDTGL